MNSSAYLAAGLLILSWNAPPPALADIPPPARRQDNGRVVAPVVIRHGAIRGEGRSIEAKLLIPRSLLPAGGERPVSIPVAPRGDEARSATPPFGTIVAGLAMSLAAVSMVFVVRGSRVTKALGLLVMSGALLATGFGIAEADVVPSRRVPSPPYIPPPAPAPAPPRNNAQGEIVIELTEDGNSVTLLLAR